jgi:hypothetical protein
VSWFSLSLVCADLGLLLVLATSHSERFWRLFRRPALLAFQVGGVLLATWLIVSYAARSNLAAAAGGGGPGRGETAAGSVN